MRPTYLSGAIAVMALLSVSARAQLISQLPPATTANNTDLVPATQAGTTRRLSVGQINAAPLAANAVENARALAAESAKQDVNGDITGQHITVSGVTYTLTAALTGGAAGAPLSLPSLNIPNGAQNLSYDSVGNPTGVTVSSIVFNAAKSNNGKFEIAHQENCTSAAGGSYVGTSTHYLGEMVCHAFGGHQLAGSGGLYGATWVMQAEPDAPANAPFAGAELDFNKLNGDCGPDNNTPVDGEGPFIAPCYGLYFSGGGTGKLTSVLAFDMGGTTGDGITTGMPTRRGIVAYHGTIEFGFLEDYAAGQYSLLVAGTKTDSLLDLEHAVINTGTQVHPAIKLGATHQLTWRNNANTMSIPLIGKNFEDGLQLGVGNAVDIASGAGAHVYFKGTINQPTGPTLISANDNDNVVEALEIQSAGIFLNGGAVMLATGVAPTANPASGRFLLYIDPADGKLKTRGSSGTITALAAP